MEAMLTHEAEENLGMHGTGPEVAIYRTMLKAEGLHRKGKDGQWQFVAPKPGSNFFAVWDGLLKSIREATEKEVQMVSLVEMLRRPPFGMKEGPIFVLICLFLAIHSDEIALYQEGGFVAFFGSEEMELMVKRPELFYLKRFAPTGIQGKIFQVYRSLLNSSPLPEVANEIRNASMVSVVGPLVQFANGLQPYVINTRTLSQEAQNLRRTLLNAKDPIQLLFTDLPLSIGLSPFKEYELISEDEIEIFQVTLRNVLIELAQTYSRLIKSIETIFIEAFEAGLHGDLATQLIDYLNFKGKNKFHTDWLTTLFFESLCNPPWLYKEKDYLGIFNEVLKNAPYLNGGLFERNELDNIGWVIPDKLFDDIFEFFESFNFTVEESTPLDIDIAINPEMLGNIYEHLVNIEERQEQKGSGIFYTPKTEIELMIRRSLVEFLYAKTRIKKDNIYYLIFEDETDIKKLFNRNEAAKILHELDQILILDPACGSGHYLVSVVKILYSLKERLWKYLGKKHLGKYEEKKKIIEKNIYGNDVKEWAVETAKLRLWLELFVDAEEERLKDYSAPLLPNFKFKIRSGDSLVQRIGTSLVPLRKIKSILTERREDLKYLIKKKESVYESGSVREYADTIDWEKKILQNALGYMKIKLTQKLQRRHKRQTFNTDWSHKNEKEERERKVLEYELKAIIEFKEALSKLKEPPMIWDLAFAEVFAKKNGFDIVIANPPYVRNEKIEDLTGFYVKTEYINKLIEQTIADWSYDYDGKLIYNPDSSTHPIPNNFPKKSDLYVYFYLKGLKLLNKNGVLCYISSNSWLDVKFGAKMQEILLKNIPIVAVYDSVKRSFKHADINTIIALMKAPITKGQKKEVENNTVRFIMFKKPYEEIMDPEVFIDIEKDDNLVPLTEGKMRSTDIYRLHTATQKELLEYGKGEKGNYEGNKWGGKYLRAPRIYWRILEKGKNKLVKIDNFADIEGYIHDNNTGEKFPKVFFLKSVKDIECIKLNYNTKGVYLFGVKQKGKSRIVADCLFPRTLNDRHIIVFNKSKYVKNNKNKKVYAKEFYKIIVKQKEQILPLVINLNSTFSILQREIYGITSLGGGGLKFNMYDILFFQIVKLQLLKNYDRYINEFITRKQNNILTEFGFDPSRPIRQQEPNPLPDRKALDDVIFDALGLTEEERKEVYWAVAELVKQRLEKARSV